MKTLIERNGFWVLISFTTLFLYLLPLSVIVLFSVLLMFGFLESILMSKVYFFLFFGITLLLMLRIRENRILYGSGLFILISCSWYGFWYYERWCRISEDFSLLQTFDFSRFVLLLTPVWYTLLGLSFIVIMQKIRYGFVLVIIVTIMQLNLAFDSAQFFKNPSSLTHKTF